jgi:hypothetical protein
MILPFKAYVYANWSLEKNICQPRSFLTVKKFDSSYIWQIFSEDTGQN